MTAAMIPISTCSTLPMPIERELVGICKQSMVLLRQQLRQYLKDLHGTYGTADIDPVIITSAKEVRLVITLFAVIVFLHVNSFVSSSF